MSSAPGPSGPDTDQRLHGLSRIEFDFVRELPPSGA